MAYDKNSLNKNRENFWNEVQDYYSSNTCLLNKDGDELTCSNSNARQISKKSKSTTISNRITTQQNTTTKYSYVFDKGRTDKRVSLNVASLINGASSSDSNFAQRVTYVLGQKKLANRYVYGFLYGCLNKSCGLIFPYTPSISFSHSVNYETTEIIHSNVHAVSYKNTPPPTISLNATFTADTRDNALHMLSALWFLRACTKCDFGEYADKDTNIPGMPPPVLYLNGYNQIMDNIPVVIERVDFTFPEDKDYVALGINLNSNSSKFIYNVHNTYEKQSGNMMLNGIKYALENITGGTTNITTNGNPNGDFYFNNWLPTELKFQISLKIVPNLLKYKKQFDLNKYKMGLYNLKNQNVTLAIPTDNGLVNMNCFDYNDAVKAILDEAKSNEQKIIEQNTRGATSLDGKEILISDNQEQLNSMLKTNKDYYISQLNDLKSKYEGNGDTTYYGVSNKVYKFDKSGWTW